MPHNLGAVTGYDRTGSIGPGEFDQERDITLAVTFPWHFALGWPPVDRIARERPTMKTTPQDELLRHRLDDHVFQHDVLLSGRRRTQRPSAATTAFDSTKTPPRHSVCWSAC